MCTIMNNKLKRLRMLFVTHKKHIFLIEIIHVSKRNRLQRGFEPVVFNNQMELDAWHQYDIKIALW